MYMVYEKRTRRNALAEGEGKYVVGSDKSRKG